jgi:hypothetical protein
MTTSSPAEFRIQTPLSALSIDDYEVLVALREAFVEFLLRPHVVADRMEDSGFPVLAV